jgi:hypothetical protein
MTPEPIIIERPWGGWANGQGYGQSDGYNSYAVEARENQYTKSTGISLLHDTFFGHIAPAHVTNNVTVDTTPKINSTIRAGTIYPGSANPDAYLISGGLSGVAPRIVTSNATTNTVSAFNAITAHGGHNFTTLPAGTGMWGEDVIIYRANVTSTSTTSLFYFWNDNADGDIGRFDLASTYDDDWGSTVPTGAAVLTKDVPHKVVEGKDFVLYITNGQYIATYDGNTGANGTLNTQALNIGAGWVASSIAVFGDYIAITASKVGGAAYSAFNFEGDSKVLLWKGYASDPEFVYGIADSFAGCIYALDTLYVWTKGTGTMAKLWSFDGQKFNKILDIPISYNSVPQQNQVAYLKDFLWWVLPGNDANIYCYGPMSSSVRGLHVSGYIHDGTNEASDIGFIENFDQTKLYTSGLFNATYKMVYASGGSVYKTGAYFRTRLIGLPYKSKITKFRIYFSQFGTGASVTLSLFKNYNAQSVGGATDLLNRTLTRTALGAVYEYSFDQEITDVDSFYMVVTFNHAAITNAAAIIRRIEVYYDSPPIL